MICKNCKYFFKAKVKIGEREYGGCNKKHKLEYDLYEYKTCYESIEEEINEDNIEWIAEKK